MNSRHLFFSDGYLYPVPNDTSFYITSHQTPCLGVLFSIDLSLHVTRPEQKLFKLLVNCNCSVYQTCSTAIMIMLTAHIDLQLQVDGSKSPGTAEYCREF